MGAVAEALLEAAVRIGQAQVAEGHRSPLSPVASALLRVIEEACAERPDPTALELAGELIRDALNELADEARDRAAGLVMPGGP